VVGLFGKPHDRWDAANLAKQQPGLADELAARLKTRRLSGIAAEI
jgi:hypothetical protein